MADFIKVTRVRHIAEYVLELTFSDGSSGRIDFRDRVVGRGGVFSPLEALEFFKRVKIDLEAGTLVWPNGVDFCPDVLHHLATGSPLPTVDPAQKA